MLQKADLQLETRIDFNDYDETNLLEIRVPLQLPYQTTWEKFERCYGTIEIDGRYYTYVKRKLQEGYMILKCIPNYRKEVIKNAEHVLFQVLQGMSQENQKAASLFVKAVKCYIGDYDDYKIVALPGLLPLPGHNFSMSPETFLLSGFRVSLEQPPDFLCL